MRHQPWLMRVASVLALATTACVADAEQPNDQTWRRTLRDGVEVELLGAYYQFDGPWFSPDGKPLPAAPLKRRDIFIPPEDETRILQFALRVKTPAKSDADYAWTFDPQGTLPSKTRHMTTERIEPDLLRIAEEFRSKNTTCSLRFGVAPGTWKTIFDTDGGQTQEKKPRIIFGKTKSHKGKTTVAVSYTDIEDAVRVVAVDLDDKEHVASASTVEGQGGFWLRDLEFDIPPSNVKHYRFQTRPYQWTTFEKVSLYARK